MKTNRNVHEKTLSRLVLTGETTKINGALKQKLRANNSLTRVIS